MNVKLLVVRGKPQGKEIPVRDSNFLIGRGTECHLRPNSELVSRQHSVFLLDGDEVRLRDLGSTNGTLVNGLRIEGEVVIYSGDIVQIGPLAFSVVIEQEAPAPPAAAPASPAPAGAAPDASTLGGKDTAEGDIEHWLLSDSKHGVPESGSGVYAGDTQMITDMDTTAEPGKEKPGESPEEGAEEEDKVVELDGGIKIKLSEAKQKVEKTREDTSQAAADILRRMMERRR